MPLNPCQRDSLKALCQTSIFCPKSFRETTLSLLEVFKRVMTPAVSICLGFQNDKASENIPCCCFVTSISCINKGFPFVILQHLHSLLFSFRKALAYPRSDATVLFKSTLYQLNIGSIAMMLQMYLTICNCGNTPMLL